jgi:hypothetical protein
MKAFWTSLLIYLHIPVTGIHQRLGYFYAFLSPQVHMLRVERSFLFNYHDHVGGQIKEEIFMAFFNSAVTVLQTLVIALGEGLGIWGATD